jgi:hypothetical protein
MAGLLAGNCFAAGPWYTCTVMASGTSSGTTVVMLSDTATPATFTNTWYVLGDTTTAKPLLATALTGSAASLRVYAYVPVTAAGATIYNLYVISDNF